MASSLRRARPAHQDDLVPDFVTSVKDGAFYGYPFSYIGKNIEPRRKADLNQALVDKAIVPDVLVTAHSAALGVVFYTGNMFPAEYQGDAFAVRQRESGSERGVFKRRHNGERDQ